MEARAKSLLGLCRKAGMLVSGEFSCEKALRDGTAKAIIVAADASDNTKKKFVNKAFYYEVPSFLYGEKETLSHAIGKTNRAVAAITDESMAAQVIAIIKDTTVEVDGMM